MGKASSAKRRRVGEHYVKPRRLGPLPAMGWYGIDDLDPPESEDATRAAIRQIVDASLQQKPDKPEGS